VVSSKEKRSLSRAGIQPADKSPRRAIMIQDKSSAPILKNRKKVFGLGYVPDRLQAAHEQSLTSSNNTIGESELFTQYMNGLRVKRVSRSSRSKLVPR
jgi:hypothetical protein